VAETEQKKDQPGFSAANRKKKKDQVGKRWVPIQTQAELKDRTRFGKRGEKPTSGPTER